MHRMLHANGKHTYRYWWEQNTDRVIFDFLCESEKFKTAQIDRGMKKLQRTPRSYPFSSCYGWNFFCKICAERIDVEGGQTFFNELSEQIVRVVSGGFQTCFYIWIYQRKWSGSWKKIIKSILVIANGKNRKMISSFELMLKQSCLSLVTSSST